MTPYLLFYVENPLASAAAIETLLGLSPVERAPTFALFVIGGTRLGFWTRSDIRPPAGEVGENSEFALGLDSRDAVDRHYAEWQGAGSPCSRRPRRWTSVTRRPFALPGPFRLRVFRIATTRPDGSERRALAARHLVPDQTAEAGNAFRHGAFVRQREGKAQRVAARAIGEEGAAGHEGDALLRHGAREERRRIDAFGQRDPDEHAAFRPAPFDTLGIAESSAARIA